MGPVTFFSKDYEPPNKVEKAWGIWFMLIHEHAANARNPSPDFEEYVASQTASMKGIVNEMTEPERKELRNRLFLKLKV